jgi:hypothetical protein
MRIPFRRDLRLKPSILASFLLLTLPVFATIIALIQAELLPSLGDRLVLFAIGILMFGVPLQLGFAFIRWLQRALGSHMTRRQAGA